jgi:hypothetical protein
VSTYPMATKARNIALAMLYSCCCAPASQPCGSAALYDQVMAAADAQMGPFVLFRGEIETHRERINHRYRLSLLESSTSSAPCFHFTRQTKTAAF